MGEIILYCLQLGCIFLTIFGIVLLINVEYNRAAVYLMLGMLACLVCNACAYLSYISTTKEEVLVAYKVKYMSIIIYYLFFSLFVATYMGLNLPKIILNLIMLTYIFDVFVFWSNMKPDESIYSLDFYNNNFFGKDTICMVYEKYPLHSFCVIFGIAVHLTLTIYIIYRIIKTKRKVAMKNYGRLALSEIIVLFAICVNQFVDLPYDFLPITISIASFIIVFGVIRAKFFRISELGRDWFFDNVSDAFIVIDKDYGYIDSNLFARQLFPELEDYKKHEVVSDEIISLVKDVEDYYIRGEDYYTKNINKLYSPMKRGEREKKPEAEGYSVILSDMTKMKSLYDEVNEAKTKAEEANKTKSAFLSNMSHEIRTPMNAIVGMTDILLRSDMSPVDRGYLKNIKSSGEALISIINDILDFSKIEAGRLDLHPAEYELLRMINDLNMIFLNRIGKKKIVFICNVDPKIPKTLYGDGLRIRQVVINLVNNAIKFTEQGYVMVSFSVGKIEGDSIEILFSVKDTGQGISEIELDKLFKSFSQVDSKKNRAKEGTGLGLAISKQLVELMGGEIGVKSKYGEGSEFYFNIFQKVNDFTLPLAVDDVMEEDGTYRRPVITSNVEGEKETNIRKMCEQFNVTYVDFQTVGYEKNRTGKFIVDFIFTDADTYFFLKDRVPVPEGVKLCVVQNPMVHNITDKGVTVVNGPLYCVNFCAVLNKRDNVNIFISANDNEDEDNNFEAPDARVLIVDDNQMNLKVCEGLLAPLKMWVDTADSGKCAIDMCQRTAYNIILMDHMMPIMDGIEATHIIRGLSEYYKDSPIIALTANAIADARDMFISEGMTDFVAKPIEINELLSKIKQYLPVNMIVEKARNKDIYIRNVASERPKTDSTPEDTAVDISSVNIPGIVVSDGIKYSGTKELFINMLGEYYKIIDIKANLIREYLSEGRIKEYTVEVHGLKSTSRLIGANELSAEFYLLEQAGNEGNLDYLNERTPEVISHYMALKPWLEKYGAMKKGHKEIANAELASKLKELSNAMENFDIDGADAIVKELEEYALSDDCMKIFEKIRISVSDVDALSTAGHIEEMLGLLE